jgi:hypothetical protein
MIRNVLVSGRQPKDLRYAPKLILEVSAPISSTNSPPLEVFSLKSMMVSAWVLFD